MTVTSVPERLQSACRGVPERMAWLEQLPRVISALTDRWSLSFEGDWIDGDASCSWVAPALRHDGTRAVLKVGMPHMEGAHGIEGLRFWDGQPTVRVLEADTDLNAMLLERCQPGTPCAICPKTNKM